MEQPLLFVDYIPRELCGRVTSAAQLTVNLITFGAANVTRRLSKRLTIASDSSDTMPYYDSFSFSIYSAATPKVCS
jgi:hypothetical protein